MSNVEVDLQAIQTLDHAYRTLDREPPSPQGFVALLAMALVLTNYGRVGNPVLNNWLGAPSTMSPCQGLSTRFGCIPAYGSPLEGAQALIQQVLREIPASVLDSGDIGLLAWAILSRGYLPGKAPSRVVWKALRGALLTAFDRFEKNLGIKRLWQFGNFEPPMEAPAEWTFYEAERALATVLPNEASRAMRMGMLLWSYTASNFGQLENGFHTHNWGMVGKKHSEGDDLPSDHLLNEFGNFAVKVYPTLDEGVRAFVQRVVHIPEVEGGDLGKLAEAMIREHAFGAPIPLDEYSWGALVANLNRASQEIQQQTRLPAWTKKKAPEALVKKGEETVKEETKPPSKRFPWEWVAVAVPFLGVVGVALWQKNKKKKVQEEKQAAVSAQNPEVQVVKIVDQLKAQGLSEEEAIAVANRIEELKAQGLSQEEAFAALQEEISAAQAA